MRKAKPEIVLDGHSLDASELFRFSLWAQDPEAKIKIHIADEAKKRIEASATFVKRILESDRPVYGVNTGFGKFAEVAIDRDKLDLLQENLIRSHCCGVGTALPRDIALMMWLIRLNTLCRGHSGVRLQTVEFIVKTLEAGMLAEIPSRGSVGASGDLSPAAHAALSLLGEGMVSIPHAGSFTVIPAAKALDRLGLTPLKLYAKEGLALINGTQLSSALAIFSWAAGLEMLHVANLVCALSIEGQRASHRLLDERICDVKNQPGVAACARDMREWLQGDTEVSTSHEKCGKVQDPYSLRCAPQVHGALFDEFTQAGQILNREINSSTDNPLLFEKQGVSLSGGNFHALYPARVSDQLCGALTILSSISERRIAQAMSAQNTGLPAFLIKEGGLNSGLMMAHVTAAALVSESKSLCHPASVDTIPTSDDREDHVSMGPGAGFKALHVLNNTKQVLAIELLAASQALYLLAPLKTSPRLEIVLKRVRALVPPLERDRVLSGDIQILAEQLHSFIQSPFGENT